MSAVAFMNVLFNRDPIAASIRDAETLLVRASEGARPVDETISRTIQDAIEANNAGQLTGDKRATFLKAYADLVRRSFEISANPEDVYRNSFEDTVEDAELLVRYSAECGKELNADVVKRVIQARNAINANEVSDDIKANLFVAYAALSKALDRVTAETIRSCSSHNTRRSLRLNRWVAIALTVFVAIVSLVTFACDSMSDRIKSDIEAGNQTAAKLRAGIAAPTTNYAANDPCGAIGNPSQTTTLSIDNIADLQALAGTTREILSRSIKLNKVTAKQECNPIDAECSKNIDPTAMLQIFPTIVNYQAEVFCKIRTFQQVRTFGDNVVNNYAAFVGGITAYALPILYAMLGAYAFRLRNFADTIQKRTYHPSFADSARMITAVIAGAVCGLFNPARGLSLSPLATAFLVGYGVELFFRFLDSLLNSFGGKA